MANTQATSQPRAQQYAAARGYVAVPFPQYGQEYTAQQPYVDQPAMEDPSLVIAERTHYRGAMAYLVAWILIALGIVVLALTLALMISGITGSSANISGQAEDMFLATLGLLGSGIALRGAGFALMMRADFMVRAHAWTGPK
jgi:predicted anti-sigma-YlaC factor YlaD